ncbi:HAD-IC family P-type ATPase, partial [Herbivorax sp. ANBcel31]|uniref:HAD-IC family P-type ATPase n=1 Tax=Herbivorax sp. ANBcel31 TaxID=3069754 RepID=UPI0027AEC78A
DTDFNGTTIYIAVNGVYAGTLVISDELREDAKEAIEELRKMGVKKLSMLTGDSENVAKRVGNILGLDRIYAQLLPHQKVEKLELINREKSFKGKLLFVGDGINDAPVLARADIGVAMGGLGSDAAIEAADIVLMTDEPSKLITAMKIAKRTRRIVWQNIIFALSVKFAILSLGAGGMASMWEAVFADVGVALLAVLNAMRVIKVYK